MPKGLPSAGKEVNVLVEGLYLQILLPGRSVNQRLRSGPVVMTVGPPAPVKLNSVMAPEGVTFPIREKKPEINQIFPSGPAVTLTGMELAVGRANSVITPAG